MAKTKQWIRLNTDWADSEWLNVLEWPVRACWPMFLCFVKSNGRNGVTGVTKLSKVAAWLEIPEECLKTMLDAAIEAGAVVEEDGEWLIMKWGDYQRDDATGATRQQRYRDAKRAEFEPKEVPEELEKPGENVTENNGVTGVTRDGSNGSNGVTLSRVTTRPLDHKTSINPPLPSGDSPPAGGEPPGKVFWFDNPDPNDKTEVYLASLVVGLRQCKGPRGKPVMLHFEPEKEKFKEMIQSFSRLSPTGASRIKNAVAAVQNWTARSKNNTWPADPMAGFRNWLQKDSDTWPDKRKDVPSPVDEAVDSKPKPPLRLAEEQPGGARVHVSGKVGDVLDQIREEVGA